MHFTGKRYGYDQPGYQLGVGFLYLWSCGWLGACLYSLFLPTVSINEKPVPHAEAVPFLSGMIVIGLLVLVGGICLHLRYKVMCIELTPTEVISIDWLGRVRLRILLSEIRNLSEASSSNGGMIASDRGVIRFSKDLRYCDDLEKRIRRWLEERKIDLPTDAYRKVHGIVEGRKVFRNLRLDYLGTGFLWIGFIVLALSLIWFGITDGLTSLRDKALMTMPLLLFALPSLSLLFSFFFERIVIDDETIEWIDGLHRTRVKARLGEIQGFDDYGSGDESAYTIATSRGDIRFASSLPHSNELREIIRRSLENEEDRCDFTAQR